MWITITVYSIRNQIIEMTASEIMPIPVPATNFLLGVFFGSILEERSTRYNPMLAQQMGINIIPL